MRVIYVIYVLEQKKLNYDFSIRWLCEYSKLSHMKIQQRDHFDQKVVIQLKRWALLFRK